MTSRIGDRKEDRAMRMLPTLFGLVFVLVLIILAGALDTAGLPPELWP